MSEIEKLPLDSMDIREEQIAKLKQLFPEAFTEGNKIDWDKLRLTLGENIDVGKERFGMNWPGKADCFKAIQQPSNATLIPDRDESVNFDTTENLFIEGDNLEVLKLLQKSYLGKIKMIYIDPPYNTGNDFIYPDNYSESLDTYLEYTGQVDSEGRKFGTNTDTEGRFHSKWMNMMYPRLFLAKNLLRDDGVIYISIDDNEVKNLRAVCDEIFGEENLLQQIIWKNKTGGGAKTKGWIGLHEYIMCYTKNINEIIDINIPYSEKTANMYNKKDEHYEVRGSYATWPLDTTSMGDRPNLRFPIIYKGTEIWPEKQWLWSKDRVMEAHKNNMLVYNQQPDGTYKVRFKGYLKDENGIMRRGKPLSILDGPYTQEGSKNFQKHMQKDFFPFPKPVNLLKNLFAIRTKENAQNKTEIILDFFSGSCTSAEAVLEVNKDIGINLQFICVQLPEPTDENSEAYKAGYKNIADIGKERIRKVIANLKSEAEQQAEKENISPKLFENDQEPTTKYQDLGFKVLKLAKSNFTLWNADVEKTPQAVQEQLFKHVQHISPEAEQEAILYELLLKSGFELTTPIKKLELEGKQVFSIGENELLICLDKQLTHELIKAMAELKPIRVICLDEGFQNNDQLKTNAALIMKSKGVLKFQTV